MVQRVYETGLSYHELLKQSETLDPLLCYVPQCSVPKLVTYIFYYLVIFLSRLPIWLPGAVIASPIIASVQKVIQQERYREVHPQWKAFGTLASFPLYLLVIMIMAFLFAPPGSFILTATSAWCSTLFLLYLAYKVHADVIFSTRMLRGIWKWMACSNVCSLIVSSMPGITKRSSQ